jgi:hypothetical protein
MACCYNQSHIFWRQIALRCDMRTLKRVYLLASNNIIVSIARVRGCVSLNGGVRKYGSKHGCAQIIFTRRQACDSNALSAASQA